MKIRPSKSETILIRVDKATKEAIVKLSKAYGITVSDVCRKAIAAHLNKELNK